ncbi:MAG: efflux RND transporter periplasmic adaptor subunit [Nitrospirae bacterium]|nr:efflux RND transporter periplasmic adaptor subunit [Nitrospirota bacterium]
MTGRFPRKTIRNALVVVLLAAVLAGVAWRASRPDPVAVRVAAVARGPVEAVVANTRAGTVKACRRAGLSPLAGGQVAELPAKEGMRVKTRDLLLSLWNDDLRARLALDEAQADAARSRAREACLVAEQSQREAARQAALKSQGIATEESYDRAATTAQARQAACAAAQSAVQVAEATTQVTRADLSRTRLTAPFDGVIAEVNAELFEFVTPSPVGVPTPPAVDLIDDSCLFVSAPIDEVDAPRIRKGMPARIAVDAFPGRAFPGTVRRVAPYVLDLEKQARTVEVEVAFDAPDQVPWLLPGLSADVEVILEIRDNVPRVPTAAVLEGDRVLLYADGVLSARAFKPGLANWNHTEVAEGLAEGDRVVTSLEREGTVDGATATLEAAP